MKLILIAPICNDPNHPWFSPGRKAKLNQLFKTFDLLQLHHKLINTCPQTDKKDINRECCIERISSKNKLFRYINIALFFVRFIGKGDEFKTDFIWAYNSRFCELAIALQVKILNPKAKLVIQIEDVNGARRENSSLLNLILDNTFCFIAKRLAFRVFYASQNMRLTETSENRIKSKTNILPPALNDQFIDATSKNPIRFQGREINILYAGGYGYDKGVDILIQAINEIPNAHLTLAGSCPSEVKNRCKNKNINITGLVSYRELYELYANTDVVVNPHRLIRNTCGIFPFKTIEHIASRALPISSNLPSLSEISFPPYLIFRNSQELVELIKNSKKIYQHNFEEIRELQERIINSYRLEKISVMVAKSLNIAH